MPYTVLNDLSSCVSATTPIFRICSNTNPQCFHRRLARVYVHSLEVVLSFLTLAPRTHTSIVVLTELLVRAVLGIRDKGECF